MDNWSENKTGCKGHLRSLYNALFSMLNQMVNKNLVLVISIAYRLIPQYSIITKLLIFYRVHQIPFFWFIGTINNNNKNDIIGTIILQKAYNSLPFYRVRQIPFLFFEKCFKKTTEYFLKFLFLFASTILPVNNG